MSVINYLLLLLPSSRAPLSVKEKEKLHNKKIKRTLRDTVCEKLAISCKLKSDTYFQESNSFLFKKRKMAESSKSDDSYSSDSELNVGLRKDKKVRKVKLKRKEQSENIPPDDEMGDASDISDSESEKSLRIDTDGSSDEYNPENDECAKSAKKDKVQHKSKAKHKDNSPPQSPPHSLATPPSAPKKKQSRRVTTPKPSQTDNNLPSTSETDTGTPTTNELVKRTAIDDPNLLRIARDSKRINIGGAKRKSTTRTIEQELLHQRMYRNIIDNPEPFDGVNFLTWGARLIKYPDEACNYLVWRDLQEAYRRTP
jgi:hypothetical protein